MSEVINFKRAIKTNISKLAELKNITNVEANKVILDEAETIKDNQRDYIKPLVWYRLIYSISNHRLNQARNSLT